MEFREVLMNHFGKKVGVEEMDRERLRAPIMTFIICHSFRV